MRVKWNQVSLTMSKELFKDIILEHFQKKIDQMKTYFKEQNISEIINFGHKLKGSGVSYGYKEVSDLGAKIEKLSEDFSFETLEIYINEMVLLFKKIENEFNEDK